MMLEHIGWTGAAARVVSGAREDDRAEDRHLRLRAPDGGRQGGRVLRVRRRDHRATCSNSTSPSQQGAPQMPRRNKIALIGAGNIGGELAALVRAQRARRRRAVRHPREGRRRQGQGARPRAERRGPRLRREHHRHARTGPTAPAPTSSSSPPACRASRACRATTCSSINLKIIRNVAENLKKHCPDAFVIVISNPLDAMVYELKKVTGFPAQEGRRHGRRARLGALPAVPRAEAGVSVKDVRAMVLGGHGDTWCRSSATARSTASRSRS